VESLIANIVLSVLVVLLGLLLVVRQKQLKKLQPPANLEQVLHTIKENLLTSRTDGKIQKVAGQLSDILINGLKCRRILFLRRQRRALEMNYVYGMKNLQRIKYRVKVTNALMDKLTGGDLIRHPRDLKGLLNDELSGLLEREGFNVTFPIFWMDNLFGVYFINTSLPADHPLIQTFLLFLNQNLSVTYHITRLESARQILESKMENDRETVERMKTAPPDPNRKETEDDPGHLIEMFQYRTVDDLLSGLFEKIRASLQAEKLVFVTRPRQEGGGLRYSLGVEKNDFTLDGEEFQKLFGQLRKRQVYPVSELREIPGSDRVRANLEKKRLRHVSTFSLSDDENGLLFWAGKDESDPGENRLLTRLERVGRRALLNAREFQRVQEMSYTDSLTALYNHRYFAKRLNEEIQRAMRYRRRLGLLLFDIDDFKLYNDNFGHQWGDELLRRMGKTLAQSLRTIDIVSRYGGDEFGIIMPEADKSTCGIFMDRLRHAIAETDFRDQANGFQGKITISIGSAIYPDDAETAEKLVYCADMALLRSKAMGRNRSTVFDADLLKQKTTE
jgi:diguanylate cyclase (GGDEF)-like protein